LFVLLAGGVTVYEPGIAELIARNRENGCIDFTTDIRWFITERMS